MAVNDGGIDKIIFQQFQTFGWSTEKDATALNDLDVSDIAKLMIKCLHAINSHCDLPSSLPHNMAQRFRCAANIAVEIKNVGFHGDLGYQNILYPNEIDLRKLFMFLIEKIPKDSPTIHKGPQDSNILIQNEAKRKLSNIFKIPWLPPHCQTVIRKYCSREFTVPLINYGVSHCEFFCTENLTGIAHTDIKVPLKVGKGKFYSTVLDIHSGELGYERNVFIEKEPSTRMISPMDDGSTKTLSQDISKFSKHSIGTPSVMQLRSAESSKVENYSEGTVSSNTMIDYDQIKESEGEARLNILVKQLQELRKNIHDTEKDINLIEDSVTKLSSQTNETISALNCEERMFSSLMKISSLSTDIDFNLDKLKGALTASKEKDKKLLSQWTEYKAPILEELGDLEHKYSTKKDRKKDILVELDDLKQQMKSLAIESTKKDTLCIQLRHEKQNLTKGVTRSVYTKQILDISGKVRLQKQEVDKILHDTRVIQKEINNLTGKLQRTFAAVENTSFKAASLNEKARPIYRAVICTHEEFGKVVDIIRATGAIQREIADLKEQVNTEKSKKVEENLKNLKKDYDRIKVENVSLKNKLL